VEKVGEVMNERGRKVIGKGCVQEKGGKVRDEEGDGGMNDRQGVCSGRGCGGKVRAEGG
jgi:hypothetical protein